MPRPNTAIKLIELLAQQQKERNQDNLFKQGEFTLQWRAKVGSYPHPDIETMIPASEPDGAWKPKKTETKQSVQQAWKRTNTQKENSSCPEKISRPEAKRNVGENNDWFKTLPLNGYIPASSIRGLVRTWANKRPEIKTQMEKLLGKQENDKISAGKIQFLDAYPTTHQKVTLDIVNPQQGFQVYHDGQSTPLSSYTLGNGQDKIPFKVAIKGMAGKVTSEELDTVWSWLQQALALYGVGSRTASGYGAIEVDRRITITQEPNNALEVFDFTLYSQGCGGVTTNNIVLRPAHWRGWLRSWVLRFLLGVMTQENAEKTLGELMGSIDAGDKNQAQKGCVRIEMTQGDTWGEESEHAPSFYQWQGQLKITAPKQPHDILNKIILPIIKFAVTVGGVGRGWRRPLHIFMMETRSSSREASRGCHLILEPKDRDRQGKINLRQFSLSANKAEIWQTTYNNWLNAVRTIWSDRVNIQANNRLNAEVFSPQTCSIYAVPYPDVEPIDMEDNTWGDFDNVVDTRGEGMNLIYKPAYKRKQDVGGLAGSGEAHCSWVSIKRVNTPHPTINDSECQEIVCVFMGGVAVNHPNHMRARFVQDLARIRGKRHLFGVEAINNPNN